MFVKKEEIKSTIKKLIDNHGQINKLWNSENKVVGYLIRYEKSNDNDVANVVFNVSFNEHYCNENEIKSFFPSDIFKYFAIKHCEKFNIDKNKNKMFILSKDTEITEIMLRQIELLLQNYFLKECSEKYVNTFIDNLDYNTIFLRVFNSIINVMNYYKNKKIMVYLDLN